MKTYLEDVEVNAPVEKVGFPLRSDTSICRFCSYYEMDREEIASVQVGPF